MKRRKKQRVKELQLKREEREKNNFRKNHYENMSKEGTLGLKDLKNYEIMYESLKDYKSEFPSPGQAPKRYHYNELKKLYYKSINSILY